MVKNSPEKTWPFEDRVWANFVNRGVAGLQIDMACENGNHPLVNMADSDKDLIQFYGPCTYRKGALIARHLSLLIGEETFKLGMRTLVKNHAWGNFDYLNFFSIFTKILEDQNRSEDIITLHRFRDEFVLETNGPIIGGKTYYYNREQKYLK